MAERLNFRLIDFSFFPFPRNVGIARGEVHRLTTLPASNSPSKKACRTSSQSEQAPAVLMLDTGAGGGSMAMRTMSLSEDISWLA